MNELVSEEIKCSYHRAFKDKPVSEFGLKVISILYKVYDGLHHIVYVNGMIERADWSKDVVKINLCVHELNTYDDDKLTQLVVLCHDNMIRLSIRPSAPRYLKLIFSERTCREGSIYTRHPTIEEAIEITRKGLKNV